MVELEDAFVNCLRWERQLGSLMERKGDDFDRERTKSKKVGIKEVNCECG